MARTHWHDQRIIISTNVTSEYYKYTQKIRRILEGQFYTTPSHHTYIIISRNPTRLCNGNKTTKVKSILELRSLTFVTNSKTCCINFITSSTELQGRFYLSTKKNDFIKCVSRRKSSRRDKLEKNFRFLTDTISVFISPVAFLISHHKSQQDQYFHKLTVSSKI